MIVYLLLAVVGALGADENPCRQRGEPRRYWARPTVRLTAPESALTVRTFLPVPFTEGNQRLIGLQAFCQGVRTDLSSAAVLGYDRPDKLQLNTVRFVVVALEPRVSANVGLVWVVETRSEQLTSHAWDTDREVLVGVRWPKTVEPYLRLGEMTAADRTDIADHARRIVGAERRPLYQAALLYDAIADRLRYEQKLQFKGAGAVYDEGVGECCDYAALFTTMARSTNLPARAVSGLYFNGTTWQFHVWAEFYAGTTLGWTPLDLSDADQAGRSGREAVGALRSSYVALTRDFELEFGNSVHQKPRILQSYAYFFQGPRGPEATWTIIGGPVDHSNAMALPDRFFPASEILLVLPGSGESDAQP